MIELKQDDHGSYKINELWSKELKEAIIVMESILSDTDHLQTVVLALDLMNTFYLVNSATGDILLINDTASKAFGSKQPATYCELLKCLKTMHN